MIDLRDQGADADAVIRALDLRPHPEGGHYRETWRDVPANGGRGSGTAILFLLRAGERSHWHRVDASELWLWQAGAPLLLETEAGAGLRLGPNLAGGEVPQGVVPAHAWQAASSLGAWTLCSCVVTPAFSFDGFELAPPGWSP
jgi:predicted cupin superfamily sugar epimerase